MENYYAVKTRIYKDTPYYEIGKDCFMFKDCKENYLLYSRPNINSRSVYCFQTKDSFILDRREIRCGDILTVKNEKRRAHFILIDFFIDDRYHNVKRLFLVGKGFYTFEDAIDYYNEHKEEIEDKNLEIESKVKRKDGTSFNFIREEFPNEWNSRNVPIDEILTENREIYDFIDIKTPNRIARKYKYEFTTDSEELPLGMDIELKTTGFRGDDNSETYINLKPNGSFGVMYDIVPKKDKFNITESEIFIRGDWELQDTIDTLKWLLNKLEYVEQETTNEKEEQL